MFGLPIWIIWLILCGLFLIIEIFNISFLFIWPGIGSFLAFICSILGFSVEIQIAVFSISTILMIIFMKPIVKKLFKNKDDTKMNNMSIIGKTGVVISDINNITNFGQVKVCGEIWSAISYDDNEQISVGSKIIVKDIQGVKLKVQKVAK